MVRRYFGTDGIRGRANQVITPELALKVGQAAGIVFKAGDYRHRVLIGKDTRLSGYMIENALVAGFTSVGMDVLLPDLFRRRPSACWRARCAPISA
jgi:phosphoglucosamine mutase